MTPLRVAFAGCGRATATLHLPALARVAGVEVVAVADPDVGAARAVAARFGIGAVHDDPAALLDGDADLIAVCTPPAGHAAVALGALAAGRHVLVEKPLTLDADEADALVAAAERAGTVAATGFNLRRHRQVLEARRMLEAGDLGRLQLVRAHWTAGPRPEGWRRDTAAGGSPLWEMGIHHFDLWRHLTGAEPVDLHAVGAGGACAVSARSPDGVLLASTLATGTSDANVIELVGDRASLVVTTYVASGPHVLPVGRQAGGVATRARAALRSAATLPRQLRLARAGGDFHASFAAEWAAIRDAVRDGTSPPATFADGRAATALAAAAAEQLDPVGAAA
jgi:predicted dehydrogenase